MCARIFVAAVDEAKHAIAIEVEPAERTTEIFVRVIPVDRERSVLASARRSRQCGHLCRFLVSAQPYVDRCRRADVAAYGQAR